MSVGRTVRGMLCLAVLAALLAGCGGDNGAKLEINLEEAIIFMRQVSGGSGEVWMMWTDGSEPRALATVAGDWAVQGTLSPNGRKMLYVEHAGDLSALMVMDLKSGDTTTLLTDTNGWNDFVPSWSPNGLKIAYHDTRDRAVHVMNSDGTGDVKVTTGAVQEHTPAWNAAGTKIVFDKGWGNNIAVINADGTGEVIVKAETAQYYYMHPKFLPDGRIVATRYDASIDSLDIVIMNADGSGETDLTPGTDSSDEFFPSVNDDGTQIAFSSDRAGHDDCFIGTLSGSTVTGLTNLTSDDPERCWRPMLGVVDTDYFDLPLGAASRNGLSTF